MPTSSTSHYTFDCDTLSEHDTELASTLGIKTEPPDGTPLYFTREGELWKQLGCITVHHDGTIRMWPHTDLTVAEERRLRGAAADAFTHKPRRSTAWTQKKGTAGRKYWECFFSITADPDDPTAKAVRACEDRRHEHSATTRMTLLAG